MNENLSVFYNSVGYNVSTDQTTLIDVPPKAMWLSDRELSNPIYLGAALRFSNSAELQGNSLSLDPDVFSSSSRTYAEVILKCRLTTYEVEYNSARGGQIGTFSFVPSPNGTLLEIFHGSQFYVSVSGGAFDLQDYLLQAAIQTTSAKFADVWANLYSLKILSTIGGFSSPRTTIQEQQRTTMLVAKILISALSALLASSLAYSVLGIVLAVAAYHASTVDVRDIAAQLSLPGLAAAAFGERKTAAIGHGQASSATIFSEKPVSNESRRILVDGSPDSGYEFRVWL